MTLTRTTLTATLSALALGGALLTHAAPAQAGPWHHHHHGGAIAAGVIGGLALGALAARPAYAYPAYPTYYGSPVYDPPSCYTVSRRFVDVWGRVVIRREEVCE